MALPLAIFSKQTLFCMVWQMFLVQLFLFWVWASLCSSALSCSSFVWMLVNRQIFSCLCDATQPNQYRVAKLCRWISFLHLYRVIDYGMSALDPYLTQQPFAHKEMAKYGIYREQVACKRWGFVWSTQSRILGACRQHSFQSLGLQSLIETSKVSNWHAKSFRCTQN